MRTVGGRAVLIVVVTVLLGWGTVVAGAETSTGAAGLVPRRVTEGTLLWRTAGQTTPVPAPVLDTDVELRVTGTLARATVRQAFTNPSAEWAEGVYVFPLPEDAAVDHLRMQVGDRVIEGVIQERAAAKDAYERARGEGKRASLVEQERPNIFTTSVANIPPGASVTVEIQYQHVVRWESGTMRLRFPMVVGPRYMPGTLSSTPPSGGGWSPDTDRVPDASRISPPVRHPAADPINPVRLRVALAAGLPLARVESPYHRIRSTPRSDGSYEITLADDAVPADRDFELVWEPRAGAAPGAVVFTERAGQDTFALLLVMPPTPSEESLRRPREVIFVVDNSGSMAGASIEQAKAALRLALARLQPGDTFNVIRFNHTTDSLFPSAEPATTANVQWADQYVAGLRATGGTEMLPALLRALDGAEHPDRLRQVVFLTDGAVGNEAQLFEAIVARLGDSRLFTIGIGSAPNGHFMREAARHGRGTFTYIGNVAEVHAKMTGLFGKLESPALTDLRLELDGGVPVEAFPDQIPDLYTGEPVMVTLRAPVLPARVVLRGRPGDTEWRHEVALQRAAEGSGVAVHWARAKIAALLDTRGTATTAEQQRRAVIDVAMTHHLVSRYTSLVAVDVTPVRPGDAALHSHALETNLPAGWDYTAVFGLGQGATGASMHTILGTLALLAATVLCLVRRHLSTGLAKSRTSW